MDKIREVLIMVAIFYCGLIFIGCALFVSAQEEKLLIIGKEVKKSWLGTSSQSTKSEVEENLDEKETDVEDDVKVNSAVH